MPYSSASDAPSYVPKAKRKQWIAVWNSAYDRAKKDGKSDKEAESSAFAQANGVAGPNAKKAYEQLLAKAADDIVDEFTNAILAAIAEDFKSLPGQVRSGLESARLSGVGQGMLQLDVSNAALLSSANDAAAEYAADRAAELVGMKYDVNGNLVENPNAEWAISDTTRQRIREIIAEAFAEDTPLADIKREIQQALADEAENGGIFSPERAELIARTEVSNAQTGGNYAVWEASGIVAKLRWITSEDEKVCVVCDENDGVVVEIGKPFPSGDLHPSAHPLCRCGVVVEEVTP